MRFGAIAIALATLGCVSAIVAACSGDTQPANDGQLDAAMDAPPCLTNDDMLPTGPCSPSTAACSVEERGECFFRTDYLCACHAGAWSCIITGGDLSGCGPDAGEDADADAGTDGDTDAGGDCVRGAYSADKPIPGVPPPVCCPGLHFASWPTDERCPFTNWGCLAGRCGDGVCEPWEGYPIPARDGGQEVCGCANDCLPDGGSTGVVLDAGPDGG